MMRTRIMLLAGALNLAATLPAHALGKRVDVEIVDRTTGETLAPIFHDGEWWVAGKPGARYRVTIANRDGRRTLNVISVDGINAISGDTASWDQTGYVIGAYDRTAIDGWRKNTAQVAAFEFASLADSYAARTGRAANVGVIGVAVFEEKRTIVPLRRGDIDLGDASRPAPSTTAPAPASDAAQAKAQSSFDESSIPEPLAQRDRLGTAHGDIEESSIRYVNFRRERPTPNEVVTIHYDRLENLIAMGIVARPATPPIAPVAVDPFPASPHFVPDPPLR